MEESKMAWKFPGWEFGFEAVFFEVLWCSDCVENYISIAFLHFHLEKERCLLLIRKLVFGPRFFFGQNLDILLFQAKNDCLNHYDP